MSKSALRVFAVAAIGHLLITFLLLLYGLDFSSMDSGVPSPISKQIASGIAGLLMMPMSLLWTSWMSMNGPNILELFLLILNSVLWGVVISLCFIKIVKDKAW